MNSFTVVHTPGNPPEFQFTVEPNSAGFKAALDAMRHCQNQEDLVKFAQCQQGYGDSNGYFAVNYPAKDPDFAHIPAGCVEVIAGYGDPQVDGIIIQERDYLELLRQYLVLSEEPGMASRVESLLSK